ncbi:hypothetical protein [Pseudobacillus wudalianchiensis]|uniref:hypothetical protein n=1 Tax=Pseudobacillus wudalianchiensis TaxID=1743143 RepID=UPI001FE19F66|nr:hypothetical protein [Bacillus wudalianchiensis]
MRGLFTSPGEQAQQVVDEFYQYEQKANFSKSWEMFHPFIKEKFTKGHYVQDRAHVFMNHFGVESFSYTLGEPEELEKWQASAEGPELSFVYKVPVVQVYKGKYGNFSLQQDVFVVQEKEDWLILWDYNQ